MLRRHAQGYAPACHHRPFLSRDFLARISIFSVNYQFDKMRQTRGWTRVGRGVGRCGGGEAVGETQNRPFQLSFNSSLKVDFQGSRVTSDGGLVLVRELDERLGLSELVDRHLSDSRRGKEIQLPLGQPPPQSGYSRLAGDEGVDDAPRRAQGPTCQ